MYSYLMIRASFYFLKGINIFIPTNAVHVISKQVKSFTFQDGFISVFDKGDDKILFITEEVLKNKTVDSSVDIQKILFHKDFIEIKIKNVDAVKHCNIVNDNITTEDLMKIVSFHYSNPTENKSVSCLEKYIDRTKSKNKRSFNFKDCDGNNFYYDEESLKPYSDKNLLFNQTLKLKNKKLEIISTALQDIKNNGLIDDDFSIEDFIIVLSYCFANTRVEDPILKLEVNSKEVSSFLEYFFIPFLNLIEERSNIGLTSVCKYFQYKKRKNYKPVKYKSIARIDRRNTSNSKIEGYNLLLNKYKKAILKIE